MNLATLATIFREIADDAVKSKADPEQFKRLTVLVVALERAYPDQMAELRGEDLDLVSLGEDNDGRAHHYEDGRGRFWATLEQVRKFALEGKEIKDE